MRRTADPGEAVMKKTLDLVDGDDDNVVDEVVVVVVVKSPQRRMMKRMTARVMWVPQPPCPSARAGGRQFTYSVGVGVVAGNSRAACVRLCGFVQADID